MQELADSKDIKPFDNLDIEEVPQATLNFCFIIIINSLTFKQEGYSILDYNYNSHSSLSFSVLLLDIANFWGSGFKVWG